MRVVSFGQRDAWGMARVRGDWVWVLGNSAGTSHRCSLAGSRSRSPSTRTGAAAAAPAAAAPAAAAVAVEAGRGAGDWPGVPAGTRTAGTVASPSSAGCTTRAPASEPSESSRGRPGLPGGTAHPHLLFVPRSGSAPARTHCGQGLLLGHPRCFPLSRTVAKGLLQPSMCLVLPPLPQAKGACPARGSPSWQCPCYQALGAAKPQAALSRGRTTPHSQALTALAASPPGGSLPLVLWCGSAAARALFRGPGRALVPLLLHDGPCLHPSSVPPTAPLLLSWPLPPSGTTSSPAASFTARTLGTCFCSLHDLLPSPAGPTHLSSPVSRPGSCSAGHGAAPVPCLLDSFMARHS